MNILLVISSFLFLSTHILSSDTEPSTSIETPFPLVEVNPILSDKDFIKFKEAFLKGNLYDAAVTYYNSSAKIQDHLAKSAIDFGVPGIVKLFKKECGDVQKWMITLFLRHGDRPFVDELFQQLKLSDRYMMNILSEARLEDRPDKFVNAVEQIMSIDKREEFVKDNISTLIAHGESRYILPLIFELRKNEPTFHLSGVAAASAFAAASCHLRTVSIAVQLSDNPAISTAVFASAIDASWSYRHREKDPFFFWSLKWANRQTLEHLKEKLKYKTSSEYQRAVDKALETASSDPLCVIRRKSRGVFIKLVLRSFFPKVLTSIVLEYYA